MPHKHDAAAIEAHLLDLESADWLEASRDWWPRFLFRSDHVENAADILNRGELLSRAAASDGALIKKDSGSPQHIAQLAPTHRRLVRLYFRPRTPTQYSNEGIRPHKKIKYGAHMPVPVYLLFSSSLLMEQGVSFSQGRLTATSKLGNSAAFLRKMNFKDIYHNRSVGRLGESHRRAEILNARHSEILVQDRLCLEHLKYVVCRSGPERDTLLNLLEPDARDNWVRRILEDDGRGRLFHKLGTFVNNVHLSEGGSQFSFHCPPDPSWRGPFNLEIEWSGSSKDYIYSDQSFDAQESPFTMEFPDGVMLQRYNVILKLNDDIAYFGKFRKDDSFLEPF